MQKREHLGRFRAAGIEFYVLKEFRAGCDFTGGDATENRNFQSRKQLLQGSKNLTIVWFKAFHIQMCVYVCVYVCVCVCTCECMCIVRVYACVCVFSYLKIDHWSTFK